MKKNFLFLSVLLLSLTGCKKETFDERVEAEVMQFNKKEAPKRLDTYTTFDSMTYDRNTLELGYYYTIESDADISIFPKDKMREELLRNLRTSIQLKQHKERGLIFRYKYYLKRTGETIIDCTFTPEEYK